jgi:hypothetical protein
MPGYLTIGRQRKPYVVYQVQRRTGRIPTWDRSEVRRNETLRITMMKTERMDKQ